NTFVQHIYKMIRTSKYKPFIRKMFNDIDDPDLRVFFLYSGAIEGSLRDAIQANNLEWVQYLIDNGVEYTTEDVDSAIKLAYTEGHLPILKYFMLIDAVHRFPKYAASYAAGNGHLEAAKFLVWSLGSHIHGINYESLRVSAKKGYLDIVKYLVENN